MNKKQPVGKRRASKAGTKRTSTTRRSSHRLTKDDRDALAMLDRLVEADRQIEQTYALPFRAPHQVATSLQQCTHCRKDVALLIFGDYARDAAGLEAYARLTADLIQHTALPAYVIAPPSDPGDLDSPALLLKVYPVQEEPGLTTPDEWEQLIERLSDEHCQQKEQARGCLPLEQPGPDVSVRST